jgi:hypothetical protein
MLSKFFYFTSLIYLLSLLAVTTNYAKTTIIADTLQADNNKPDSISITGLAKINKPDSLKTSITRNDYLMRLKNKFNRIILPNDMSQYFPKISIPDHLYHKYNFIESNELDSFKQNLSRSLNFGYHDLTKYNLGVIGNYLGKAKELFAIVLAILSL